jgi:undecaprenyl diphosphate synthase
MSINTRIEQVRSKMAQARVPTFHVGIIMDGNGRWAEARGLSRVTGHARGARRVTEIVKACPELGVTHLTLYAFSTENWRRPLAEVEGLMRIFRQYILSKMDGLRRHDVRVRFLGMRHRVPPRLRELMELLEARTRHCRGLNLSIAIDYGGRDELTRAVRALSERVAVGALRPGAISEELLAEALDTRELPDPDLVIRTSGELRISNFLLWQGAYAEYDFPPVTWPDFTVQSFAECVDGFHLRRRRFGRVDDAPAAAAVSQS